MCSPEPPERTSSPQISESLKARRKEATLRRKRARKSSNSLKSWDSAEYWQFRKEEEDASLELIEIEWEAKRSGVEHSEDVHAAERDYQRKKAEIEERTAAATRKIDRYLKRTSLVSAERAGNPESIRSSFLELMLALLTRTSCTNQSAFAENLADAYGSTKTGRVKCVWCPVDGTWEPRVNVKASHIFPLSLGKKVLSYILGPDVTSEINSAKNGLFLHPVIKEAFDNYQVVIVPADEPKEWKFLILDRSGLWRAGIGTGPETFADLHNTKLQFQPGNDFRPRARCLYFHYLLAMLQIGRSGEEAKAEFQSQIAEAKTSKLTKVWASDGEYLRENMIRAFIEGMAQDWPDLDPADMLAHAEPDRTSEVQDMLRTGAEADVNSDEEDEEWP